jgi:hypothetical protein
MSVMQAQEERLITEVCEGNEFAAVHVASTILWQLQRLGDAVADTADDAHLRSLFAQGKAKELAGFLEQTRQRLNRELPRQGGLTPPLLSTHGGPLASMVLLDRAGRHVAESPVVEKVHGKVFLGREYFRAALRRGGATGRARVHVSRIFQSASDDLHKLALSIPVKTGAAGAVQGVLIATVATDSSFGLEHLHDRRRKAVLLAPRDANPPALAGPDAEDPPRDYVVLLHRAYEYGEEPVTLPEGHSHGLRRPVAGSELDLPAAGAESFFSRDYRDPVAARHAEYDGRWLAGFAPVGNTELVVVVQQRHDEAVAPHQAFLYRLLGWGAAAVVAVLGLLRLSAWALRRWGA